MKTYPLSYLLSLLFTAAAFGDVTYTQTTQMTGGALLKMPFAGRMKQPTESTTIIKGNRMAHLSETSGTVWDLDKETVTDIDFKNKTYSAMTFAEMRDMYEKMLNNMNSKMDGKKPDVDMSFDVKVNETGNTKTISGYLSKEIVMTLVTKMTDPKSGQSVDSQMENHLWVSKDVPASKELGAFYMRLAKKIGFTPDAMRSMQTNPQFAKAAAAMAGKSASLEGFHMMSVTRLMASPAMTAQMAQASEAMAKARAEAGKDVKDSVQDSAEQSAISSVAGRLGRFGGIGASGLGGLARGRKKVEAAQEQEKAPAAAKAADPDAGVMSELTMTTTAITSSADGSKFDVPAGFKRVESRAEKSLR